MLSKTSVWALALVMNLGYACRIFSAFWNSVTFSIECSPKKSRQHRWNQLVTCFVCGHATIVTLHTAWALFSFFMGKGRVLPEEIIISIALSAAFVLSAAVQANCCLNIEDTALMLTGILQVDKELTSKFPLQG